jgi:tetratricopeptide (TPR) repeat protein
VKLLVVLPCLLVAPVWGNQDPAADELIARARTMAEGHRYGSALELLEPLAAEVGDDPELAFSVAAELGRAYFHLGRYDDAHDQLERAAALHPESVEVGIYRGATAYITGRRQLSFAVFREILRAGARDLFLPVALPGERQFLAEPRVWELLSEYEIDLPISLTEGTVLGATLGMDRGTAARAIGAPDDDPTRSVLSARAGPKMLWALRFDSGSRLQEVVISAENLFRYTPYRLRFACGLDWRATPELAVEKLGLPATMDGAEDSIMMTWEWDGASASLIFGPPLPPTPPPLSHADHALLTVRLGARAGAVQATPAPGR